jgi:UDP-N-acetylglucosamine 2-epimerase (non-hydrolysing)/GDP/UDP-N,N'-diacetylbacillosamine 2-epimerase (hydrolysing)
MGDAFVRTIGVVTVGRSDYGIYLPLLRKISQDSELRLHLMVTGMHLSPEFGRTVEAIEKDGFPVGEKVEMLLPGDSPSEIAQSVGRGTIGFAKAFFRPDLLVVLGDRFEMFASALAALPFRIPVAHIHGGELTEGAIDDALRHSMTKLSHLHFVATEEYARRVRQLGEEPWRVVVSGAPSLDNLSSTPLLNASQLETKYDLSFSQPTLLVTYHPVTLEYEQTEYQTGELLAALETLAMPVVFTLPNADTSGRTIARMLKDFTARQASSRILDNLGTQDYFSFMSLAAVMVGNSSSGLVEAPSFHLPVVNIGARQRGRIRGANVIDVGCERTAIIKGVKRAISREFKERLKGQQNPYGSGNASDRIVETLKRVRIDARLLMKRFFDIALSSSSHPGDVQ